MIPLKDALGMYIPDRLRFATRLEFVRAQKPSLQVLRAHKTSRRIDTGDGDYDNDVEVGAKLRAVPFIKKAVWAAITQGHLQGPIEYDKKSPTPGADARRSQVQPRNPGGTLSPDAATACHCAARRSRANHPQISSFSPLE